MAQGSGSPRSGRRGPEPELLQQVVPPADQGPLPVHLLQAPQQELPESPALLDLSEHWLHRLFPNREAPPAPLRPQLPPHPVPGGEIGGYASPGRRWYWLAVAGLVRCDERVDAQGAQALNRPCRIVARAADTSLGTTPVLAMACSIMLTACCLSDAWLVASAATIT